MTANNTTKWYRELPRLVDLYNNTPQYIATGDIKPNKIEGNEENEIK